MKRLAIALVFVLLPLASFAQQTPYNPFTVELVRLLSKDFFDLNSIPYLEPMVTAVNATSNARFFHSAYIPSKDTLYFRFGIHTMMGFVRDDQKQYVPSIPTDNRQASDDILLNAVYNEIKAIFKRGVETGNIVPPPTAPTILGYGKNTFVIPVSYLREEVQKNVLFQRLDTATQRVIDEALGQLPGALDLPPGGNMNTIVAAIPQLEIGSLFGTELLIRYIPPLKLDSIIGKFSFWGIGLKHSLSQYWDNPWMDVAAQVVYQGTTLKNTVGVTSAELTSKAKFGIVINNPRNRLGQFTIFSGLAVENADIAADYVYTLPRNLQASLNLIVGRDLNNDGIISDDEFVADPANGYPGDTKPQTSSVRINTTSVKWTLGAAAQFGPVSVFADYSISKFNILSAGVDVQF
jgi:hypothetical protein